VTSLAPGTIVDDRFRLQSKLGAGGMGDVHEAVDLEGDRVVALKLLRPELALHAEAVERFRREARATRHVRHAHVVEVVYAGVEGPTRRPFIAYERLFGATLDAYLSGPLDEQTAVEIALPLLDALAHAHAHGVIHRDVKPSNVLIAAGDDGSIRPMLIDFGLTKALRGALGESRWTELTATGVLLGSASTISPEQIEGAEVDGRCDIWAMGVVLYRMLAGVAPFRARTPTLTMLKIVSQPHAPVAGRAPAVSPAVADVVEHALRKVPSERWPSAAAMRRALRIAVPEARGDGFLRDLPAPASATTPAASTATREV
jgi:serine/threonine-protein kinase